MCLKDEHFLTQGIPLFAFVAILIQQFMYNKKILDIQKIIEFLQFLKKSQTQDILVIFPRNAIIIHHRHTGRFPGVVARSSWIRKKQQPLPREEKLSLSFITYF